MNYRIPVSADLIQHVKRLDGFNPGKDLQSQIEEDEEIQNFLKVTLMVHQILSLTQANWENCLTEPKIHLDQILKELETKGGLDYIPRERTPQGRVFEHASDSKILVKVIQRGKGKILDKVKNNQKILFYINIDEENQFQNLIDSPERKKVNESYEKKIQQQKQVKEDDIQSQNSQTTQDTEKNQEEGKQEETLSKSQKKKLKQKQKKEKEEKEEGLSEVKATETSETNNDTTEKEKVQGLFSLNKNFVSMTLNANGKADLYFHAYVWISYIKTIFKQCRPNENNVEAQFEAEIASKKIEISRLKGLSEILKKVAINIEKFPFGKESYDRFIQEFGGKKAVQKIRLLEELQRSLFVAQISNDQTSLQFLERLLIQLMGYSDMAMRDQSIVLLNMLYDEHDWQLTSPFRPVIRSIGQHFKVNVIVDLELENHPESQIFMALSAPYPADHYNQQIMTWHKIDKRNIVSTKGYSTEILINFGKFWKCGFYDWRLVIVKDNGRLQPLELIGKPEPVFPLLRRQSQENFDDEDDNIGQIAQGRFIVHAKGIKEHSYHEVQVDYQDSEIDYKEGRFIKKGNFKNIEKAIPQYKKKGINCLYLMGVLERDNYPYIYQMTNEERFKKPDAAPLASTCRTTCNRMLGGEAGFKKIMEASKTNKVKVIVDCLARISSSRHHRKYKELLLHYLDEDGKRNICYGTDGSSVNYEDSAMLNYRKIETWNLLIDEVIQFVKKFSVDGIHLDNCQAWPQIMELDVEELTRVDVDGTPAYSPMDFMNGEIVLRNENYGYWNTNMMEKYPNPFFIKMSKKIWEQFENFMIIGECWGGYMFENRQIILARSAIIPRMFKLPQAISSLLGKKLHRDGRVTDCQKENVLALKKWYENGRLFLPEGSIIMQSSSAHSWPYPAYMYGKASWAAVDILYFMPDIPITFMGEIDGEIYRLGTTQVFQHEQSKASSNTLKRKNSQIMMALTGNDEEEETKQISPDKDQSDKRLVKVRSGSNLAALVVETKNSESKDIKKKEEQFLHELEPHMGFDLKKIGSHYESRRRLRKEKMVLRYGQLVPLVARHEDGWHQSVLAFARHSLIETAIIATNLSENKVDFYIDLSDLKKLFLKSYSANSVIMLQNWLGIDEKPTYYFLKEFLMMKQYKSLDPYRTQAFSISLCVDDPYVLQKTMLQSIERTKYKLLQKENIENDQICLLFTDILEKNFQDIGLFANVIGSVQEVFLEKLKLSFYDLFLNNNKFKDSKGELASRMLALCKRINEASGSNLISPNKAARSIIQGNRLGPIIFCSPELGRWSTVGGLGVMVDELAYGLALLGQDVWVISPYYDRNRKGETGYLARDPAKITYQENISVQIEKGYVLGVHEGVVNNVKVIFLHNQDIFPTPYPDTGPDETVRAMSVFGKGCLEFCCAREIIPSVLITNDWFTGLIPGYAKVGLFGDTFKGTTFLHIAHNLEPSYEGRIFPTPQQGCLESIHQLPKDWLMNPYWTTKMINPSRCAILNSDQWATVSNSYKQDLLSSSPLRDILSQKTKPFAFPNGIPIQERIKKLNAAAPDHFAAKRLIQMKYFNYSDIDDETPLFAFVGRITTQKGVHLILDAAEMMIQKSGYKINILVGGPANMKEKYSADCASKMWYLKNKYPNCFWADPQQFFLDGSVVNRGSDFGLMPSIFEPGGIVQHEFFVGETPVIAFKTGGLKDSVFEFKWDTEEGNGYTFESHTPNDLLFACQRAIGTFQNKDKYMKLRKNAFKSTMDGETVSKAWLGEFFRLREKVFVDENIIKDTTAKLNSWKPEQYKPMTSFQEMFGLDKKMTNLAQDDIDQGADDEKDALEDDIPKTKKVVSDFEQDLLEEQFPHPFMLHNQGPRYNQVQICGSFDNWQKRHNMDFDFHSGYWYTTFHLKKGKYFFKYIINGNNWIVNDKEPKEKDPSGNMNNVIQL